MLCLFKGNVKLFLAKRSSHDLNKLIPDAVLEKRMAFLNPLSVSHLEGEKVRRI